MFEKLKSGFQKLKDSKNLILGNFAAAIGGAVLAGIVATAFGESLGYGALIAYLYGATGQERVAKLLEKKIK